MDVSPVRSYKKPLYPNQEESGANPEILLNMPKRWQGNVLLYAFISSTILLCATSCKKEVQPLEKPEVFKIAPIFTHGDGIIQSQIINSSDMGVIIKNYSIDPNEKATVEIQPQSKSDKTPEITLLGKQRDKPKVILVGNGPPWPSDFNTEHQLNPFPKAKLSAPLKEVEALKIITDEAQKAGVSFDSANESSLATEKENQSPSLQIDNLDGISKNMNLAFEYVSTQDADEVFNYIKENPDLSKYKNDIEQESTPHKLYRLLDMAQHLRETKEKEEIDKNIAIFYDPGESYYDSSSYISPEEALRKQVQDFINWLKSEGILFF